MNLISPLETSIQVGPEIVERFSADPDFPYLISFPRTGSHWLRMIMELYFETPSLVRLFFYRTTDRFTCYHRHDEELTIQRRNVLYLYRHPVDTVYSQLVYYREDPFSAERIAHWATLYGRHLKKWLLDDRSYSHRTILTYEGMKSDMTAEFSKVCDHFSVALDPDRLVAAVRIVTHEEVQRRTPHDPQVINRSESYRQIRQQFVAACSETVWSHLHAVDVRLAGLFVNGRET